MNKGQGTNDTQTPGQSAAHPAQIPPVGWKDILLRVKDQISADRIGLIAAGVAFYGLLALFPALSGLMALAGLVLDPADITAQIATLTAILPQAAAQIILDQATKVAASPGSGLGFAFVASLGLALYSASKGVGSLIQGLNICYAEDESRGFFLRLATTLGLTVLMILGLVLGLVATLILPAALAWLEVPQALASALGVLRWVVLGLLAITGLAALYRWGPSRSGANWRWLTPGAAASAVLWLLGSIGFSLYVANFASYNESFGSIAGVIILLMWLWLSAYIVLLGAELNAEVEAQTARDTTTGPRDPLGQRGAHKANTLA